ncbi:MAG: FAD-dependent monooxygenase [Acidobacteriota bacterium]|jgi:kynurenine 3-monooxygenase|nr:FAD-dependent monooxygenase [Acidobacteriota bacterium]
MARKKVIIIGAGLSGSLLSLYLAKRGIKTEVYESRGDMRLEEMSAGRSINLALSDRGIRALKEVGMDEYMLESAVPMYGRLIHSLDGERKLLPYSGREGEYINSVSRGGLNIALINEADNYEESTFYFNQKCVDFDCESGEALIENSETGEKKRVKGDTLIATDGAGSAVRRAMMNSRCIDRFNYSQSYLEHGYKELSIPSKSEFVGELPKLSDKAEGEFLMEKNALHIWARHQFMMIALPNFDGSFTCTLFLAYKGEKGFDNLNDEASLMKFFEKNFADAISLMPNLVDEFFTNPTGNLGTIKCFPWNVGGKSLLLGDSAHAIVPFYGQGMNASFEDCRIFDELLEKHGTDWEKVFEEYSEQRKINTDAIAELALENFYEMRDSVADPVFVKKRELETKLEHTFPDYFSKYSLVTFREDIPYSEAKKRGNAQNELLMKICENVGDVSEIDLNEVMEKVKLIQTD